MTIIGVDSFSGCSGLTSITIENPFPIDKSTFSYNTYNGTLYVPIGTIDKYRAADGWKDFLSIKEFEVEPTGDANGDDTVDIADVAMIISKIQGESPSGFNIKAADMNGDGRIDHVDLTTVVNLVLNQGGSF